MIRLPPTPKRPPEPWLPALRLGLSYSWRVPHVRELLIVAGVVGVLIMPAQAFLPAFARDVLNAGPQGYGWLLAAVGAGAIFGAFVSGARWVTRSTRVAMAAFALIGGVSLTSFAVSQWLPLSLLTAAGVGFASIGFMVVTNSTLQLSVRDDLIGRVMGLYTVVNAGVQPVGSLVQGVLSEQITLGTTLAGAGVGAILLGLAIIRWVGKGEPIAYRNQPPVQQRP
jgi:predicted MFS family arabinose efflux permease